MECGRKRAEIRNDNREIKLSHLSIYCFIKIMEFLPLTGRKSPVSDVQLVFLVNLCLGKVSAFCFL